MYNYETIPSYQGCKLEQSTRGREFQQHGQMGLGNRQCGDGGKAGPPPAQAQVVGNHPMPMGTSAWVAPQWVHSAETIMYRNGFDSIYTAK